MCGTVLALHLRLAGIAAGCLLTCLMAQVPEPIVEAQRLIREKNYSQAVVVLNQAKLGDPSDPRPYFYAGLALMESGHLRLAGPELQRAMQLDPDQPEFPLLYAEIQARLGLNSGAAETLQVFADPAIMQQLEPRELWLLADLYLRLDLFEDALKTLDRLVALHRRTPETELKRGEVHLNRRDFEQAAQSYQLALEMTQNKAPAYYGLGVVRWKQGALEEAHGWLLKALQLEPENSEYRYHLGQVCLDLGQPEEAIQHLTSVESLAEEFPAIYNALARAYRRVGNRDRSREYFEKFQRAESRQSSQQTMQRRADSLVRRAVEKLQAGEADQAGRLFHEALELQPEHWTALKYLTRIYLASRDWVSAQAQLKRMETLRPQDFDVQALTARYWYERSQAVRARGYAEAARQLNPGDAELRNLLGNIYLELGLRQAALQEYQAAVTLAPDRQDFRLNYESLKP